MSEKSKEIVPAAVKSVATVIEHESEAPIIVAADDKDFVREVAFRIRARLARTHSDILEIGIDLLEVKKRLGHGNFGTWIRSEFNMSEDSAARFMNVARHADQIPHGAEYQPAVLYALAAPSTPPEVREEIGKRAAGGEKVTLNDVKKLKAELAANRTAMAEVDQIKSMALQEADLLKSQLRQKTDDLQKMEVEIKRLGDQSTSASDDDDEANAAQTESIMSNSLLITGAIGTIVGNVKSDTHAAFWAGYRGPINDWARQTMKQHIEMAIGRLTALKAASDQATAPAKQPIVTAVTASSVEVPDIPAALLRTKPAAAPAA